MQSKHVEWSEIEGAARRLKGYVRRPPLLETSEKGWLLKPELFQPTGSFKVRPAFNGMLAHLEDAKRRGVVASSSGNYAQAVAYAAHVLGVHAKIVMTSSTAEYKVKRTEAWGAEIHRSGPSFEERWSVTRELQERTGALLLHPYDSAETIAGDATVGLEIVEDLASAAESLTVLVPSSGAGLVAGVAIAVKHRLPRAKVYAVQTAQNGSLYKSWHAGRPTNVGAVKTIADALVASQPGDLSFAIVREQVDGVLLVDDSELAPAMRWLAEEQKIFAEPGGAAAVAAVLTGKIERGKGHLVTVVSGGNIEPERFCERISS